MPRQPTEATARALVLVASGRSVQEAATAAGIAVSTLTRAMKRTGVTTNRRRSRRTAVEIQAAMEAAKEQAQALAVEREARPPKAPTRTALQRLHWLQTELEQQGRKEAADLRAVLDWVERKKPSR
ncbi:hypothetical protein [uncultured Azohydromonas sp.]|jgi:hypothetical protein|uniref:hypothetical protein n=1 Tax=uncultured Azohydromonas sp. TaxID=487342 RepID=UPI0026113035|nr:hypothetical protein [uncultured Azohydromonas sp.]